MSLADELLADLEDDNEELEELVKVKVESEDEGKRIKSKLSFHTTTINFVIL